MLSADDGGGSDEMPDQPERISRQTRGYSCWGKAGYMTQIRAMLKTRGEMPLGEFKAAACAMIPAEATRYGRTSRRSIVEAWIKTYWRRVIVAEGVIRYCYATNAAVSDLKRGPQMLAILKASGRITQEQSGFKRATWNSYSRALRRLQWVKKEGRNSLIWCGPDNATWVSVTRENSRREHKADKR